MSIIPRTWTSSLRKVIEKVPNVQLLFLGNELSLAGLYHLIVF